MQHRVSVSHLLFHLLYLTNYKLPVDFYGYNTMNDFTVAIVLIQDFILRCVFVCFSGCAENKKNNSTFLPQSIINTLSLLAVLS